MDTKLNKRDSNFIIAANEYTLERLLKAGSCLVSKFNSGKTEYYVLTNTCSAFDMDTFSQDDKMSFAYSNKAFF